MSTEIAIFIGCMICGFTIFKISKVIFNNPKFGGIKDIITILLIGTITYFLYEVTYKTESNMLKVILSIIVLKFSYKETMFKTVVGAILTIGVLTAVDLFSSLIFSLFITVNQMRGVWYFILLCNITVFIISIITINIPIINKKIRSIVPNLNERSKFSSIVLLGLYLVIMLFLLYNISINYNWSAKFFINVIIAISYFITIFIFIKDRTDYNNLFNKYEGLFEFLNEIEDNIDKLSFINHEYKNQIAVLKGYIENNNTEESLNYINNIIEDINIEDKDIISQLNNIPKGGLKGLLYYKIITSKNKKVELILDVSKTSNKYLKKLNKNQNRTISKILGVYIDNAIEAATVSKIKIVNIEIYAINNEMFFVISNSFKKEKVNLNKIGKKGYSTKGKGHGKGLYLANKEIRKTNYLKSETQIINDYYIQKLILNEKEAK